MNSEARRVLHLRARQSVFYRPSQVEPTGSLGDPEEAFEELRTRGIHPWFPPPAVGLPLLLVRGRIPPPDCVAIVGSRAVDPYGLACARQVALDAHALGYAVVSGGAEGCDEAAHRACLEGGGCTVVVLGHGHDHVYPRAHKALFESIEKEGGSVVSPYWPTCPPKPYRFKQRNEVIARLARAVVVVRARRKSGAISTATAARRLGRPLLAVPSNVGEGLGEGCNQLIADGAAVMTGPGDLVKALDRAEQFLEPWPLQHGGAPSPWPQMPAMQCISPDDEAVAHVFERGEILDLDTLRMRSGLPVHTLVARLLGLEISGRVEKTPANTYRLTR